MCWFFSCSYQCCYWACSVIRYHTTINGKRPPESSHMEVDGDDSTPHQAIKRPKTDINGFDYPMIATTDKQSAGDLCNGQLPDVNHDKLNHLSVEVEQRRDRLSQSPSPRLTQSDKPVVGSPRNNGGGVGEVKELVNSRDRDALVSNEDRRSNVESEPEVITLSDSEDELREVRRPSHTTLPPHTTLHTHVSHLSSFCSRSTRVFPRTVPAFSRSLSYISFALSPTSHFSLALPLLSRSPTSLSLSHFSSLPLPPHLSRCPTHLSLILPPLIYLTWGDTKRWSY